MPALALVLAALAAPTPVSAYGTQAIWSARGPDGAFHLMSRSGALAVAPRAVPFDADLGPGPGGHVTAVYSRCRHDPPLSAGFGTPASYERGRGCDVYAYDLARQRERRVAEVSSPVASEAWPALWHGRLAFERAYDAHPGRPYLYVHRLGSRAASRRLPGGPRPRGRATGLDLRGRTLAFAWTFRGHEEGLATQIRLDRPGKGSRVLDQRRGGGLRHVVVEAPALEGRRVYWAQGCFGDSCSGLAQLFRRRLGGGAEQSARGAGYAVGHARGGGVTYVVADDAPVGLCQSDPPGAPRCRLRSLRPRYG